MGVKGGNNKQTPPVEAKDPMDARDAGDEGTKRYDEKSRVGPPPDATKRERGTGAPSDAGRGEVSSTLEES